MTSLTAVRPPTILPPDVRTQAAPRPAWCDWNDHRDARYTVGAEEEVMLLGAADRALAQASDEVLSNISVPLASHVAPETHASVIELITSIHSHVGGVVDELVRLRVRLAAELRQMGLSAASAGTYPLVRQGNARISRALRYSRVAESMRSLARREPTLALHAHVGVTDPEDGIRVLNGVRAAVPLLLALSANSPFSQGQDTGFASTRTVIFQGFPRTGPARRFDSYDDYVGAVDALIASGAVPDPSFLWWDVRLQPRLGTVEVRVMDSQSTVADSGALIAFVQSLAHLILEEERGVGDVTPEVLAENRFLAARDGIHATLIDPSARRLVPVRTLIRNLAQRCRPHAAELGCLREFDQIEQLLAANGADRQRATAARTGVSGLVPTLAEQFSGDGFIGGLDQSK